MDLATAGEAPGTAEKNTPSKQEELLDKTNLAILQTAFEKSLDATWTSPFAEREVEWIARMKKVSAKSLDATWTGLPSGRAGGGGDLSGGRR